jgi:CRISPR-associated exonuclease Cas4
MGRNLHDQKLERNKEYLRKKIGVIEKHTDQYLTDELLRGNIDEVLLLRDGTMAPLDYKFAKFEDRIYETYRTQLECYALLIEENFKKRVRKGFLVYTRSSNKLVEVEISDPAKQDIRRVCEEVNDIILQNYYPRATKYKQRCIGCTYRNICIK